MSLKNVKIYISEIPKEWTNRLRSGHTNIWNDKSHKNGLPETRLDPPIKGLYAEKFNDGWYWVCGCYDCLENGKPYSYIKCDEHNVCVDCGTHRKDLNEIPWGVPDGFQCKPCAYKEKVYKKAKALSEAKINNHDEWDCYYQDDIICPVCATVNYSEEIYENSELSCYVCDTNLYVEVEHELKFTTTEIKKD